MVRPWKEPVKETISVAQLSAVSALYGSRPAAAQQGEAAQQRAAFSCRANL